MPLYEDEKLNEEVVNEEANNDKTDSQLFQTGLINQLNYMDKYPKSKEFMEEYKKKNHIDTEEEEKLMINKVNFQSLNIPVKIQITENEDGELTITKYEDSFLGSFKTPLETFKQIKK